MAHIHSTLLPLSHLSLFPPSSSPSPATRNLRLFSSSQSNKFNFQCALIRRGASSTSQMNPNGVERPRFEEFPYASAPIRDLMVDLVSTVEIRLDSQLLPCKLPPDVEYFHNQSGTAHGSLLLRPGAPSSPIDCLLGFWLHCELPTGGALNITSLISYMNDSTDAPHLLIEFIQSSPTSLVVLLDLPSRRDLVLHPGYLKTFYEDTRLEQQRQLIYKIPEVQPYISPSLYIRGVFSPTAVVIRVDTSESGGDKRLEEIVRDNVSAVVKEVLGIWFELCVFGERLEIRDDDERAYLKKRDHMFKSQSIEIDLGSSLPRLFGQEIADRVLGVLRST